MDSPYNDMKLPIPDVLPSIFFAPRKKKYTAYLIDEDGSLKIDKMTKDEHNEAFSVTPDKKFTAYVIDTDGSFKIDKITKDEHNEMFFVINKKKYATHLINNDRSFNTNEIKGIVCNKNNPNKNDI